MLNTESLSFPDCRHFLQLVTVECIYILQKIQIVLKVDTTFSSMRSEILKLCKPLQNNALNGMRYDR